MRQDVRQVAALTRAKPQLFAAFNNACAASNNAPVLPQLHLELRYLADKTLLLAQQALENRHDLLLIHVDSTSAPSRGCR